MDAAKAMNEPGSFHRFPTDRLPRGDSASSPEECLEPWRAENPPESVPEIETQAIRQAIEDMRAGDTGQPLQEFVLAARARWNHSS